MAVFKAGFNGAGGKPKENLTCFLNFSSFKQVLNLIGRVSPLHMK